MAEAFLYIGTVLIAFEIVRDVSHLPTLIIILWWKFFRYTVGSADRLIKKCQVKVIRIILRVLLRVIVSPVLILAIATALVIIVIWLGGTIIILINNIVNRIYRKEMKNMQITEAPLMGKVFRFLLPGIENEVIESAIDKVYIRFVAIIGIIFVTVGFLYKLLNI